MITLELRVKTTILSHGTDVLAESEVGLGLLWL